MQELRDNATKQTSADSKGKVTRHEQQRGTQQRTRFPTAAKEDGTGSARDFEQRCSEDLKMKAQ